MKKTIKLRDMTAEQYQDYLNNNCVGGDKCSNCVLTIVNCQDPENRCSWFVNKDMFSKKFLDQEVEIEVPDILTKEEKEYLSNIIKPFRDRVISIKKTGSSYSHFISIKIQKIFNGTGTERIDLPFFEADTMYRGMEVGKEYTLADLGLNN